MQVLLRPLLLNSILVLNLHLSHSVTQLHGKSKHEDMVEAIEAKPPRESLVPSIIYNLPIIGII